MAEGPLLHPSRLAADLEGRIAVSDRGHHRILFGHMVGKSIEVQKVIGCGEPGFREGALAEAAFRDPEGLALSGDMLIVADRGNHVIRVVDLSGGEVATMAGTGERAGGAVAAGDPLETPLREPWDVLLHDYDLFIAMSGPREVWRLSLREGVLAPHLAAAAESAAGGDASARGGPAALATDEHALYVADAATSRIERVAFEPGGDVETLIDGAGANGDGDAADAAEGPRLRQPAGLEWGQGNHRLWISDTGNQVLKMLDPSSRLTEAVEPFEAELDHPTGLTSAGHLLFVADTNHHRILRVDQIDKRVIELDIESVG